jgi:hypothetical protein
MSAGIIAFPTQLLTRKQASDFLGVTEGTLAVWACTRRYNLPFVKVGRCVKYRLSDLERFLAERTIGGDGDPQ